MSAASLSPACKQSVMSLLLPIMAAVLVAFLVIGLALPVLPLHVHQELGFGAFTVGLVTGSQFAASLLSRVWSGRLSDTEGPKRTVLVGLVTASAAGALYLLSMRFSAYPGVAIAILLAGRAVLGAAESCIITGATVWGLGRAGNENAGKVIAWTGTAMFIALAIGAPFGIFIYQKGGFAAVAVVTAAAPLLTLLLIAPLRAVAPERKERVSFLSVARHAWLPGLGAALASIGFGVIVSFGSLLFALRGWTPVWLAFTCYAAAIIVTRALLGHLPDRLGGARVALVCALIEAAGLALMGFASSGLIAAVGATLTGAGYALLYPGLGVEAVRRAPPESRGMAMGAYSACLDVALGTAGPLLGLIASASGLSAVFLASALCVFCAVPIALLLRRAR
jgi:MFS family permease